MPSKRDEVAISDRVEEAGNGIMGSTSRFERAQAGHDKPSDSTVSSRMEESAESTADTADTVGGISGAAAETQSMTARITGTHTSFSATSGLLTRFDIMITWFQQLGVFFTINVWPSVFKDVFIVFTIPFNFNFDGFALNKTFTFYLKMVIPLFFLAMYFRVGKRPFAWKQAYIQNWQQTQLLTFSKCLGLGGVVGVLIYAMDLKHSGVTAAVGAVGTALAIFTCWFLFFIIVRGQFALVKPQDEHTFFCRYRANIKSASMFGMIMIYLPVGQVQLLRHLGC